MTNEELNEIKLSINKALDEAIKSETLIKELIEENIPPEMFAKEFEKRRNEL